ncbi:hypothetical protein BX281_3637 [Streptomyces sp. Ag82_O1-15]|nr:hypothetical protein BX281_3637 [Streptomyces sp. Ag82_O1-15]
MFSQSACGPLPSCGPASQVLPAGPIEVFETSSVLPPTTRNQPPPEEPPVIVQPMRYIVGRLGFSDSRPGRSTHSNIFRPLYGGAAG